MNSQQHAMTVANDVTIGQMIDGATRRLIVVAPGLSMEIAEDLAERWRLLGPGAVSVTLDVDPEVCRMGFGDIEAVKLLEQTARSMETTLNTHPGIRIGVIIADDETLIYAPTPLLVEASPRCPDEEAPAIKPNAIRVGLPPADLERDLGAGPDGVIDQIVGLDSARREVIEQVGEELKALPPQPFDLTRHLRVFTAHLEFVEFRMHGWKVHRRSVTLPPELVSVVDEKNRALLESKFHLLANVDTGAAFAGLERLKEYVAKRFLVSVPGYGSLIRIKDKPKFERAVATLGKMLNRACTRATHRLQKSIKDNVQTLTKALLPIVKRKLTEEEQCLLMPKSDEQWLSDELMALAGEASDLFKHAKVEVRYKGVTYETLNDKAFVKAVKKLMPDMTTLHHETDAAPASNPA